MPFFRPPSSSNALNYGITFTLGALTASTLLLSLHAYRRRQAIESLKASIPSISEAHHAAELTEYGGAKPASMTSTEDTRAARTAARARKGEYSEELILEQLARNRLFLGDDGLQKLRGAFVVVVGLGGVGSHAVSALVRSGVGRIRIVDFDQITLSSLNRHAVATLADVGSPKVFAVRRRMEQIAPWCRIECVNRLLDAASVEELVARPWDYELRDGEEPTSADWVVDAIDNIDTKVELLRFCVQRGFKVVSAMGAACKSDPTRVCAGDISESLEDPLSKATRRRLRLAGVKDGVPVVFSTEKPGQAKIQDLKEEDVEKGEVGDLSVLPDFRVRILPVLGTMPAVFGYTVANLVICRIAEYPIEYRIGERGREKMYEGMLANLQGLEERLARHKGIDAVGLKLPLSRDDISYLVEEVYRGKSVVSGLSTRLVLTRWERPKHGANVDSNYIEEGQKASNLCLNDLVVMTKEEAKAHEQQVLKGQKLNHELYSQAVIDQVQRRQAEERAFDKYR